MESPAPVGIEGRVDACISLQVSEIRARIVAVRVFITRFTVQKYFIFLILRTIIPKFFNNFAACKLSVGE